MHAYMLECFCCSNFENVWSLAVLIVEFLSFLGSFLAEIKPQADGANGLREAQFFY